MKKYVFIIDLLEIIAKLMAGKVVKGVLYIDKDTHRLVFRPYNITSDGINYRAFRRTLYETPNGRLVETSLRYKLKVSIKKTLGRQRSAMEMQSQARELSDYLKHTKSIDEILDEA